MRSRLLLCLSSALLAMGLVFGVPSVGKGGPEDFTVQLSDGAGDTASIYYSGGVGVLVYTGTGSGGVVHTPASITPTITTYNTTGIITLGTITISSIDAELFTSGLTNTTVTASGVAGNVLTITTAESSFGTLPPGAQLSTSASLNSHPGNTGSFTGTDASFISVLNTPFFTTSPPITYTGVPTPAFTQTGSLGPVTGIQSSNLSIPNGPAFGTSGILFSLANQLTLTFGAGSTGEGVSISGTSNFTNSPPPFSTPAPTSRLLAVASIPVFGLIWMVRCRRSKVESAPAIA